MEGKIIYEGQTKNGEAFVIRYPQKGEARAMVEYINILSKEKTFILFQGEQLSLDYELDYLRNLLEKIEKKQSLQLSMWCDDKIIGIAGIDMKDRTESHKGEFGISIGKEYRGQGLGKILMETVMNEAKVNIPKLKIVTLSVFAINYTAYEMYKKFGFNEYGRLPEGLNYKKQYVEQIFMYKHIF